MEVIAVLYLPPIAFSAKTALDANSAKRKGANVLHIRNSSNIIIDGSKRSKFLLEKIEVSARNRPSKAELS